jgi:hypothetical protein
MPSEAEERHRLAERLEREANAYERYAAGLAAQVVSKRARAAAVVAGTDHPASILVEDMGPQ